MSFLFCFGPNPLTVRSHRDITTVNNILLIQTRCGRVLQCVDISLPSTDWARSCYNVTCDIQTDHQHRWAVNCTVQYCLAVYYTVQCTILCGRAHVHHQEKPGTEILNINCTQDSLFSINTVSVTGTLQIGNFYLLASFIENRRDVFTHLFNMRGSLEVFIEKAPKQNYFDQFFLSTYSITILYFSITTSE